MLSLPLAALLTLFSLASCMALLIPDTRPAQTTEDKEQAQTVVEPKENMSPAEVYEALCGAESVCVTVDMERTDKPYRLTVKKNGGKVMVEYYSEDNSGYNYVYTESTQYYDLDNEQIYYHDRNLNWSVEPFEEEIRWVDIVYTELVDEDTIFAYEDENYDLTDGTYVCRGDVLAALELERPISDLSMSSKGLIYTFCYGVRFAEETAECTVKIEFCKPPIEFPEVKVGDAV